MVFYSKVGLKYILTKLIIKVFNALLTKISKTSLEIVFF